MAIVTIMSTIQLSSETKELLNSFGGKADTYEDIIKRLYKLAVKEQLREFLMSEDNTLTISQAKQLHKKRWQK